MLPHLSLALAADPLTLPLPARLPPDLAPRGHTRARVGSPGAHGRAR